MATELNGSDPDPPFLSLGRLEARHRRSSTKAGSRTTRRLAREEEDMRRRRLVLPEGEAKASLVAMVEYVLERIN